jgi:hypothetical protein
MAIEKTINLNVDSKQATKGLKDLEKGIDDVNKEIKQTSGNTSEMTNQLDRFSGGAVSGFKGVIGVLKGVTTGFKSMRVAIISTGVGALIIGITALTAAFKGSEEGQNKFNKILSVVGALTGNLVDLLADLGEAIINAFTNPIETIKGFSDSIKTYVMDKINNVIDGVGLFGDAIKKVFSGDFKGALNDAKDGFVKLHSASPFGIIKDGVDALTKSTKEFVKEQINEANAAAKVADMRAKADKIERELIVERSKLESEIAQLRLKSRQEEQFSAEERKQALLDAQKLEDSLLDKETEFLKLRRDAQIQENTFSRSNKENLGKEAEAIAAVNRQVAARANAARQVQREVNTISKQIEAQNKAAAAEEKAIQDKKIADEKLRTDAIEKIQEDFRQKQKDREAETELEKINLEEERKLAELNRLNASELQKQEVRDYYNGLRIENQTAIDEADALRKKEKDDKEIEDEKALAAAKKAIQDGVLGVVEKGIGVAKNLAGKNKKVQKALLIAENAAGIAKILINTAAANAASVAASPLTGGLPWVAINTISGALGVASAISATSKGLKALGGGSAGSAPTSKGGAGAASSAAPKPPSFNIVGASDTNQLADAVAGQENQPVQAYVVANDVTSAQSLQNNIVEGSTID